MDCIVMPGRNCGGNIAGWVENCQDNGTKDNQAQTVWGILCGICRSHYSLCGDTLRYPGQYHTCYYRCNNRCRGKKRSVGCKMGTYYQNYSRHSFSCPGTYYCTGNN